MYPFTVRTHDQLLTLAYKTKAAAGDGDPRRLEAAALKLFQALANHIGAEHPDLLRLAPPDARLLERGQQRLVEDLIELAATAASSDPGDCRCGRLADTLLSELTLQADDERRRLAAAH